MIFEKNSNMSVTIQRQGHGAVINVNKELMILLAGELHNSSASSLSYIEPILDKMAALHLNTVLIPISWELIEPEENIYNFSLIDDIVDACRNRNLHIVFLWFGTLKNAISCYIPSWVKMNNQRFFRAQSEPGKNSWAVSVFCEEIMKCDAKAFTEIMNHIKKIDADTGTVLMMQVENEPGILGAARDHCPAAEIKFNDPVPDSLIQYLSRNHETLIEEIKSIKMKPGTWTDVFGDGADEIFMAWHVAQFIENVAAAGRKIYDIPMFVNAWLIAGPGYAPGQYPSGGPVSKLIDIWRAAAPAIDFIAPDIYLQDFRAECASYTRGGNILFIPEAQNSIKAAANVLYAIGKHKALGFSPFAIDDLSEDHPLSETYKHLNEMMPVIIESYRNGNITGFLQQEDEETWNAELGDFIFMARTCGKMEDGKVPGSAILLSLSENEFIIMGRQLIFTFMNKNKNMNYTEIIRLDIGRYQDGKWVAERRLNGDETAHGTGILLGSELQVVHFILNSIN